MNTEKMFSIYAASITIVFNSKVYTLENPYFGPQFEFTIVIYYHVYYYYYIFINIKTCVLRQCGPQNAAYQLY